MSETSVLSILGTVRRPRNRSQILFRCVRRGGSSLQVVMKALMEKGVQVL
ncbi:MAG: hypothetical protein MZV64_04185 [Ignavibacteriales bacterium]|nr:hypothetical protein [Ignavibacteriales bacterium]